MNPTRRQPAPSHVVLLNTHDELNDSIRNLLDEDLDKCTGDTNHLKASASALKSEFKIFVNNTSALMKSNLENGARQEALDFKSHREMLRVEINDHLNLINSYLSDDVFSEVNSFRSASVNSYFTSAAAGHYPEPENCYSPEAADAPEHLVYSCRSCSKQR